MPVNTPRKNAQISQGDITVGIDDDLLPGEIYINGRFIEDEHISMDLATAQWLMDVALPQAIHTLEQGSRADAPSS